MAVQGWFRKGWIGVLLISVALGALAAGIFADPVADFAGDPAGNLRRLRDALEDLKYLAGARSNIDFRAAAILGGLFFLWLYVYWWVRRSGRAFERGEIIVAPQSITGHELQLTYDAAIGELSPKLLRKRVIDDLWAQLSGERHFERVQEEVLIMGWAFRRKVNVTLKPSGLKGDVLTVINQPSKQTAFRDFHLHGKELSLIPFEAASALTVRAILQRWRMLSGADAPAELRSLFEELVNANISSEEQVHDRVRVAIACHCDSPLPDSMEAFAESAAAIVMRRPQMARSEGVAPRAFTYELTQPVRFSKKGDPTIPLSGWLKFKRRFRNRLNMTPKIVSLPVRLSLFSVRYQLDVVAPQGMYVREVGFWNYGTAPRWFQTMVRGPVYPFFSGTELAADLGRARANISRAYQADFNLMSDPRLAIRFPEVPPGSLVPAVGLAFIVWPLVWIAGVFYPEGADGDVLALLVVPGHQVGDRRLVGGSPPRAVWRR
ncbi:hypothetical protein KMZ30_14530 [Phycicoccus sp. KQZ13P-1]|uniref:hypothetical protein n=1 Tax=Phycicoccus mangrovi TaxID=2840470 RepID=UPI001BFFEF48|nr:hypothetical protein [Phycicoccus mangrovi]MBT9256789.1 hypothetical protein [Phycicoccus mangrovi]